MFFSSITLENILRVKYFVKTTINADTCQNAHFGTTLRFTGPVNAIGTQLRDPINSGLTRWRMAVP